jgi:hypothetical protein
MESAFVGCKAGAAVIGLWMVVERFGIIHLPAIEFGAVILFYLNF